ncbi:MAG: DUF3883 domain-containing protein [Chloroflexi bacterium]|nr:DUF3883 domain-containing protein [Chloroflexota bacterium]
MTTASNENDVAEIVGLVSPAVAAINTLQPLSDDPEPDWIPATAIEADRVVSSRTRRKIDALLRERGFDEEVETTRQFVASTIPEYAERFLLELLQNAHDALPASGGGRVAIVLDLQATTGPELLVANTGTPFRFRDFRALCRMAQSEKKPGEGIGHKGVGFKSVLQVAPRPEIYSAASIADPELYRGFRFTFPDSTQYTELIPPGLPRMTPYSLPLPIPLDEQPASVLSFASQGYATAIRLPLRANAEATARDALANLLDPDAPVLLYLDRITQMDVTVRDGTGETTRRLTRSVRHVASGGRAVIEELDLEEHGRYLLIRGEAEDETFRAAIEADVASGLVDERWLEWSGAPPVGVALPQGHEAADDRLYCYLPLAPGARSPIAGHVHAPFAVGLARKDLVPVSRINEVLLDAVGDVCVDAAPVLRNERLLQQVVDLVAWPRERGRITAAWKRSGQELREVDILPVLGSAGWASFADAWRFEPTDCSEFSAEAVALVTGEAVIDPMLGHDRLAAVTDFASDVFALNLDPPPNTLADWAVALAGRLARARIRGDPAFPRWLDFYDDLPKVFPGTSGRALAGRRIILGEEGELLETWAAETPSTRRRRLRGVFFPPREGEDAEAEAWEGPVPRSLRQAIARVHPRLDWYVVADPIRRNRPGRRFLEDQGLVRIHRVDDLLRLVERVLERTRSQAVWRDALVFVYRLTRPSPRRPDLGSLGLSKVRFRVPSRSGWIPAPDGVFSRGWTSRGDDLMAVLENAGAHSAELAVLEARLLVSPEDLVPRGTSLEGWIELLKLCGVRDGLWPQPTTEPDKAFIAQAWWWAELANVADHYGLANPGREEWLGRVDLEGWPHTTWAEYIAHGSLYRLPGQDDFHLLPVAAKRRLARLVVRDLPNWPEEAFSLEVRRRSGGGDAVSLPTPLSLFLLDALWMPVGRPGSRGDEDQVSPGDAWLIADDEREPYFAPIVAPDVRRLVGESPGSREKLRQLGIREWSNPADAKARLSVLGRLLEEGRILPGFHAQVRNAAEEAWQWIVGRRAVAAAEGGWEWLVVSRGEHLESNRFGQPFYVLAETSRMLELVLASLDEPVLVAPPDVGEQVLAFLGGATSGARLVWPSDLQVEVDGRPVSELLEEAEELLGTERAWLSDLVALTLVLRQQELRAVTANVLDAALARLHSIRLVAGSDISLRLDGQRLDVPAYSRGVVPVTLDGSLLIAWQPGADGLDWHGLRRLAPAIADLIGERWARDALENTVRALGEGGGPLIEPDAEAYSEALGVPKPRITELRSGQRQAVDQVLERLLPVLAYFIGAEAARAACQQGALEPDAERALAMALGGVEGWPPGTPDASAMAEAVRTARGIGEVRDRLVLDFGRFNLVLVGLGGRYQPEVHPDLHASQMWSYVAAHKDQIADALRAAVGDAGLSPATVPDVYLRAIQVLDQAAADPSSPGRDDPLAADPEWQILYREPPTELLNERVNGWLGTVGAPSIGASTGLRPVSEVRAANGGRLRSIFPRIALIALTWLDRQGRADIPAWTADTESVANQILASGRLDFVPLADDALVGAVAMTAPWPSGLGPTLDLASNGLTEHDLENHRSEAERHRIALERSRKGVEVAGRLITLDQETIENDLAYVLDTVDEDTLAVSPHELALGSPPAQSRRRRHVGGGSGSRGRPSKEKLEAIGLIGEVVALKWLRHHYGEAHVRWRATNRAYLIRDGDPGDDGVGYDFDVIGGRSPLYFEVKAHTADPGDFDLSEPEVEFALSKSRGSSYRILYIPYVGMPEDRTIFVLPNPLSPRAREFYRVASTGIKYAFRVDE